jgi:hypothetical protein
MQGDREGVRMSKPLSIDVIAKLNVVLLRCATRAERNNAERHAEKLAREVAAIADELAVRR